VRSRWVPAVGIEGGRDGQARAQGNGRTHEAASRVDAASEVEGGAVLRTRSIGYAILRAGGFETVDEVVIAEAGDLALLGARTLEGFGAVADARRKRLVASGPHPAAPAETARRSA
jgi:hypothetical protein